MKKHISVVVARQARGMAGLAVFSRHGGPVVENCCATLWCVANDALTLEEAKKNQGKVLSAEEEHARMAVHLRKQAAKLHMMGQPVLRRLNVHDMCSSQNA